jgi:hypothetical protein
MIMPSDNSWLDAEFDRICDEIMQKSHDRNETPDPEMGNLTPTQVHKLLYTKWGERGGAVQFRTGIPLERLESAAFFRRARWLAIAVRDADGVKATATLKNLPRKLVTRMVDETLTDEVRADLNEFNKVLNEEDVTEVHVARIVCQAAGVVVLRKGVFVVPKGLTELLDPDRAGALYQRLFAAFFQTFNLAYLDRRCVEASALQSGVAYTLYRLGVLAKSWCSVDKLGMAALLPAIREELEVEIGPSSHESVPEVLAWRVLRPLMDWGLLEGQFDHRFHRLIDTLARVRTTALYGEFLRFEL